MKKQTMYIMIMITCIFSAFTIGFLIGRNFNHNTIFLSELPSEPRHIAAPKPVTYSDSIASSITFPVDINTAGIDELSALPGIGTSLAQRILDFRAVNGAFSTPEELLNVKGIGGGKLEAILDYITTGG